MPALPCWRPSPKRRTWLASVFLACHVLLCRALGRTTPGLWISPLEFSGRGSGTTGCWQTWRNPSPSGVGGIADGVLSVSAVQWLLDGRPEPSSVSAQATDQGEQAASSTSLLGPQTRLRRLFRCLRQASVPCARMALQFYPPKGDHDFGARALVDASRAEGFDADVVLDFPHRGTAKKWVLVAQAPPALDVDSRNF
ncbi:unnamed protein product, partial [Polarella glacialis]